MILGITGGIGCGKSTAAKLIESRGFRRIDLDQCIREDVLTQAAVKARLVERFGPTILDAAGAVDRPRLGERVFDNPEALAWLEELTHPPVFAVLREKLAEQPNGRWVVEVPLLFEKNMENWFDFTITVACAPSQQLARLEQRGLPHALAEQRISKQLPLSRKLELADLVLWNDGDLSFLQDQVDQLLQTLPTVR
jgi:dephospho-CoA kinase